VSRYLIGSDVLGAVEGDRYLTVRLKDPAAVVRAQGGAAGALALRLAPNTVLNAAYDAMKKQFEAQSAARGVELDVAVHSGTPSDSPLTPSDFLRGTLVGGGVVGLGWVVTTLVRHLLRRK